MVSLSAAPAELLRIWWPAERVAVWLQEAEALGPIAWPEPAAARAAVAQLEASAAPAPEPLALSGETDFAICTRAWWPIERIDAAGAPYWLLLPPMREALPRGGSVPLLAGHGRQQVGECRSFIWGGGPDRLGCLLRWGRFTGREQRWLQRGAGLSIGALVEQSTELQGRLVVADRWQLLEVSLSERPGAPGTGLVRMGR